MTLEGEKIGSGEPFCKHFPQSLLNIVKDKKENDRHALLLLWFYFQTVKTGKAPQEEYFMKRSEDTSYPLIRKNVGKTMMDLLESCFTDKEEMELFFEKWEKSL